MLRWTMMIVLLTLAIGCAEKRPTTPGDSNPVTPDNTRKFLPKYETEWEQRRLGKADAPHDKRMSDIARFKITLPPTGAENLRFPGEFEPTGALLVGWVYNQQFGGSTLDNFFIEIIKGAWGATRVLIPIADPAVRAAMISKLKAAFSQAGINPDEVDDPDRLQFIEARVDTIWARDFGPQGVVHTDSGNVSFIDTRYYHYRVDDDKLPTLMGEQLDVNVFRPALKQEGGNFQSNGDGICFTSRGSLFFNAPDPDEAGHKELYRRYFGCRELVLLQPLEGEGTTHIDMFMMVIGKRDIVVGEYKTEDDCVNRQLLEKNVALLKSIKDSQGNPQFRIHRVPMPSNIDGVWRTYTNFQMVRSPLDTSRGVVLVPVYNEHNSYEAEMEKSLLNAFQLAHPQVKWSLIKINSDQIIRANGAIHCVVHEIPAGMLTKAQTEPAALCGNSYLCQSSGCGEISPQGYCDGNNLVYCQTDEQGNKLGVRWAPCGTPCQMLEPGQPCERKCGFNPEKQWYDCLEKLTCQESPGCQNECVPDQLGCSADQKQRFECVRGADGCYTRQYVECTGGQVCSNGTCAADPCGGIDYAGVCEGDVVKWCENNQLRTYDCTASNMTCGYKEALKLSDCVEKPEVPTCSNECDADSKGCDANLSWVCETNPQSGCLVKKKNDCGELSCSEGVCVELTPSDPCGGIDARGRCEGDQVQWCYNGKLHQKDCSLIGKTCGHDVNNNWNGCVDQVPQDPCQGLDSKGICEGAVVKWCYNNKPYEKDCAQWNQTCGFDDEKQWYGCMTITD